MSKLILETNDVQTAIKILFKITDTQNLSSFIANFDGINAFSQVSGLREAGNKHATIANTHNPQATDAYTAMTQELRCTPWCTFVDSRVAS